MKQQTALVQHASEPRELLFAVVAEEVRNLAQRSAEAAKNTANMIEESVKNAEGGVRITEEVAKILIEIGEGNRKVNDLVSEIATASAEQSSGIEQVNLAVAQLDKVIQQNAANSEESASAAEELNSQAVSLSQTVGQFKIASRGPARATPAATTKSKLQIAKATTKATASKKLVGAGASGSSHTKSSRFLSLDEEDFAGF